MKTFLLAGAMLIAATGVSMAQSANGTGTATSSSNSGAIAISGGGRGGSGGTGVGRGGNANSQIIFNTPGTTTSNNNSTIRYRSSGSLKTTPTAAAPGLGSAGIETCFGPGVSGGVSVTGFGASFGAGQWDTSCNRRLNARTLFAFGYKQAAINIMMNEPEVQAAFGYGGNVALAGVPTPRTNTSRSFAGANSSGLVDQGCKKWSGGATGVGRCLF